MIERYFLQVIYIYILYIENVDLLYTDPFKSLEQEATLFRGTNMATRILSIFARETCIDYIRLTLQPAMELINALPEESLTWEMDPQKLNPNESVVVNKQNVCRATEIFLEAICNSTSSAPR